MGLVSQFDVLQPSPRDSQWVSQGSQAAWMQIDDDQRRSTTTNDDRERCQKGQSESYGEQTPKET